MTTSRDMSHLHPSTIAILRYFAYDHLPAGPLRATSTNVANLAHWCAEDLPQGPELTTGLRKLLEAKDCFVRAALDTPKPPVVLNPQAIGNPNETPIIQLT